VTPREIPDDPEKRTVRDFCDLGQPWDALRKLQEQHTALADALEGLLAHRYDMWVPREPWLAAEAALRAAGRL
jgi:hypothetical protein